MMIENFVSFFQVEMIWYENIQSYADNAVNDTFHVVFLAFVWLEWKVEFDAAQCQIWHLYLEKKYSLGLL